jgi:hypothetical protein
MSIDAHDFRISPDLVQRVRHGLRSAPPEHQNEAIEFWAEALGASRDGTRLVALLAGAPEPEMRHLTMRVAARLPPPLDPQALPMLRHLLLDRRVPEEALLSLAAALLRSTEEDAAETVETLAALVAGLSKAQKAERLRQLEERVGRLPVLAAYRARVEEKIKLICPRCQVEMPRPQMVRHLWREHGLLMDGQSVRGPWRMIQDWVEEYRLDGDPKLLEQSRALAQWVDPQDGLSRVHRLFLANRVTDGEALRAVREEAALDHAALCPHCYASVPVPDEALPQPLHVIGRSLAAYGYRVELSEHGLLTRLEVETPERFQYAGPEPGRWLTVHGATFLLAGPPVLLAVFLAALLSARQDAALLPVALLLGTAAVLAVAARLLWRPYRPLLDRLVDYAWLVLVPRLHAEQFTPDDARFLAALAQTSAGRGQAKLRAAALHRVINITENALGAGAVSAAQLGALWQLAVADAAQAGVDPVLYLASQLGRCFGGHMPLVFAQPLLAGCAGPWLSAADRARLRVVLCDRAFEAGCEVRDLLELGRIAPSLAALLDVEHPYYLAQLRLLWSLRPTVPWDRCGSAANAFELASNAEAGRKHFGKCPDLLLAAWDIPGGYVSSRGLYFHDVLFDEPPRAIEIKARPFLQGGGFELVLGPHRFWFQANPEPLVGALERWLRYFFRDFRPRVAEVYAWPTYAKLDNLHFYHVVNCPECQRPVRARVGEVGMAV